MDPITLATVGSAAASIGGSLFGANQAAQANKTNMRTSLLNYYQQEIARAQMQQEAARQQYEAKLGGVDASGNRTRYVPGIGWVEDLAPEQEAIRADSEREMQRQLVEGTARDSVIGERAARFRGVDDARAREAMRAFADAERPDVSRLRDIFLARGAQTRNEAADRTGGMIARQAIRAGGGANAAELMAMARGSADQAGARQAGIEAELMATDEADRRYDNARTGANQLYDYFRSAAVTGNGAPRTFNPSTPQRSSTGVADQGLINALGRAPAQRDYVQPNMAWTNALTDLGKTLGAYAQSARTDKFNDAIIDRWGTNAGSIN